MHKILNLLVAGIEINNIAFSYEDEIVVDGLNLKIPKGKSFALVGQSGSGKSTLANLICRFYDVNSGSINVDGINIKNLKKDALRNLDWTSNPRFNSV